MHEVQSCVILLQSASAIAAHRDNAAHMTWPLQCLIRHEHGAVKVTAIM